MTKYWRGSRSKETYQINNEVRVDVNVRLELMSKSESRLKLSGYRGRSQVG